ncbi:MAG: phosphoglucomutase/phosphomannomutase family protein [Candidatus Sericytochromatia bacterium]|nr:phosphoglucomutase/phosphomannomutase family protein [Candidatus Tanganyikabacteria bacterium]
MAAITFGTDGWRDLIAEGFTFDNVRIVSAAIGRYVAATYGTDRPVIVAHDTRFLARDFARTAVAVLRGEGLPTLLADRDAPTPVIAHAAQDRPSGGAVMITASHNPPQYCGIKYIPDYAGPATKEITDRIVAEIGTIDGAGLTRGAEDGDAFDPGPRYREAIARYLDIERMRGAALRVAYDAMHATGRGYTDELLRQAGCTVATLRASVDPYFGGAMPEPAPRFLADLTAAVTGGGMALGVANDGDADRFGVVGEDGRYYVPNQVIALLARHLHRNRGMSGAIVRTVATSHLLDRLAARYGLPLRETPVGFKWVGAVMRAEPVLIGGEESGGLSVLGHVPEKDGVLADLLVAEMIAREGKPLSAIWADLVAEVGFEPRSRRLDLHLSPAAKEAVMDFFRRRTPGEVAGRKVVDTRTDDGVKLILEGDCWLLARPSGTEPIIRIYLEAPDDAGLEALHKAANGFVADVSAQPAGH